MIDINIYNFNRIEFLIKMLLYTIIIIISDYKRNLVQNNLIIEIEF